MPDHTAARGGNAGRPTRHRTAGAGDPPDPELLAGLAARDPEITRAFVRRFHAGIAGTAMAVLHNPRLAEDAVQQTYEQALRHAGAYDPGRGTVNRWVTAIAHNAAVDLVRSRRRLIPVDPVELAALRGEGAVESAEEEALAEEILQECRAAVAELPGEQRRALVLAGCYRMTAREISERERIPLGTAKTRIRLAAGKVRAVLGDRGADAA